MIPDSELVYRIAETATMEGALPETIALIHFATEVQRGNLALEEVLERISEPLRAETGRMDGPL